MQLIIRRRLADRVWQWRKVVYAAGGALVLAVLVLVFLTISLPSTILEVSSEPTFFDAGRAYRATQQLSELERRAGERTAGSEAAQAGTRWLTQNLESLRLPHQVEEFEAHLGRRAESLVNVAIVLPGQTRDAVLVTAPRDPLLEPQLGPDADASATAILLNLAQVFAARPHDKTLIFLSSEGGGSAGLGIDRFLRSDPRGGDVRTVLSFRGLGREGREEIQAGVSGPDTATPGWYVRLTGDVFKAIDLRLQLPGLADQIADHALRLDQGEQVAGLRHDRAAIYLFDLGEGRVTSSGLSTQGAALERLVLSLDAGVQIPRGDAAALVLPSGRYLTTRAVDILALVMLLPCAVMAATWLAITRVRPEAWLRYLRNMVSFIVPMLSILGLAWLLAALGMVPRFDYQASAGDAAATSPDLAMAGLLILAFLVIFFASRHFLGYLRPREPLVMAEMSKLSIGLLVFLVGLGLLMSHSPFSLLTAVTAAWTWPLATCFAEPRPWTVLWLPRMRSNALLLLSGLTAPALLYVYLVAATPAGWTNGWWFLFVQTMSGAYGLRGPLASALLTTGFLILLGVKRLQLLPMETLEEEDDLSMVAPQPPRVRSVRRVRP